MGGESVDRGVDTDLQAVATRLGQALLAVVAALVAGSVFVSAAASAGRALGLVADSPELVVVRTVGQFVGFAAAALLFVAYAGDRGVLRLGRPTAADLGWGLAGTVALLVGQYALLFALSAVGIGVAENQALSPGEGAPRYYLYMVAVSVLFVGPGEELVFRGVAQGELRRALPAPAAVGVAAALFGVIHAWAGNGTPLEQGAYVAVAFLLGCVLGLLYEARGTLVVPALAHGLYNATLYALRYANETGLV
ncbi:CPBP family intramembrane glutamic endopeptidase [Candidatus Halobonum tyrrellensis]|uniref:Abortive infection protein n=1 Tax=Candidatus Halobonum tyrrellensis G22 TaxID=1324957 RepID=V4HBE5_9EURY|nr:CPBP family intramembrane glutamic endopeptidase [Candidatus Halobonum tyrrellensis]ESP87358.1 abortive infection protein [Candidatus Halobonum tyrrellensis G22]